MVRKRSISRRSASKCSYLPLELWAEILARLPVKTLLKFRCVCKEWRSVIESPNFASSHLNLYKNNRELTHLLVIDKSRRGLGPVSASIRCADTFRRIYRTEFPDRLPVDFWLNGYAGGLLLWKILDSTERRILGFILWNPSIRKSIKIPPPKSPFSNTNWVGLGYDAVANECKVVFISVEKDRSVVECVLVHIYSVKGHTWRSSRKYTRVLKCWVGAYDTSTLLNGAIHWIEYDVNLVPSCNPFDGSHVLAFDMRNEVFNSFRLPNEMNASHDFLDLAVLGESLALLEYDRGFFPIHVHVMKEYGNAECWVKRCTIELACVELSYLKRNGELVFTLKQPGVKTYDIESEDFKNLAKRYNDTVLYIDTFVESLVLLT